MNIILREWLSNPTQWLLGEAELFYGADPLLEEGKFYEKVLVNDRIIV